ncbi:hypothetical protein HDU85_005877 [Gaertneriomyces sp. JEL0708]|nr:hypothetical protein BC832DRAFT_567585 [Gaertneriomyces semiglobifer]KAJ3177507.1 hypothetical protein HDU85_005877 [Gaertneriomyces sp. JEL0708]
MPRAKSEGATTTKKTAGGKRGASPYNQFMKTELVKVKEENPSIAHREAFKLAASRWKNSEQNPNRIKA